MQIRDYSPLDFDEVVSILKEADLYDEIWDSKENILGLAKSGKILIAQENNKQIGVVYIINFGTKVAIIFRLAVRREFRNKGIASALIEKIKETLKHERFKEVGLYVDSENKGLLDFYSKRKFTASKKSYLYMWSEL